MYKIDTGYTELIIIGNGFDLSLGLPTGYTHFLQSDLFNELVRERNIFAQYYFSKQAHSNWVDIENELKFISAANNSSELPEHFEIFCDKFKKYISRLDYSKIDKDSNAYTFLRDRVSREILVLDFNYTSATRLVLKDLGFTDTEILERLIKVHGSVDDETIIFGVEDNCEISDYHVFLKKTFNPGFKGINLYAEASKIQIISIFGHSLGDTDKMYFDDFFQKVSREMNFNQAKQINLYHYGKKGYRDLHMQLEKLTQRNLFGLKKNTYFKTWDTSE